MISLRGSLLFLWSGCLCGTTIVVIRNPGEIVVAADSKATFEGDGAQKSQRPVCKIYQEPDGTYFALSGFVNDPVTGFNLAELVRRARRSSTGIAGRIKTSEQLVQNALPEELARVRTHDYDRYAEMAREKTALSVIVVGVESGVPVVMGFSAMLTVSQRGVTSAGFTEESCPGNCQNGVRGFWLGDAGAIRQLMASGSLPSLAPTDLAKYLVQLEINSGAPSIGGPIDLLRVTPQGVEWIQRKSGCPDTNSGIRR